MNIDECVRVYTNGTGNFAVLCGKAKSVDEQLAILEITWGCKPRYYCGVCRTKFNDQLGWSAIVRRHYDKAYAAAEEYQKRARIAATIH